MSRLELEHLTFARKGGFCLGPLDLTLRAGSRTAIIGPSGAGKSTLLRCIAGLERPADGRILEDDVVVNSGRDLIPPHQRKLGFLFQDGALWPHMTALQHLTFAAPTLSRRDALDWLERVGLEDKARRRPAQLSGGEGRRLALARALCGGATTLLLDEPLHSLDVHLRDGLALLIRELTDDAAITSVLVTHDREEALAMAEDLVVLDRGKMVEQGPTHELIAAPRSAWTAAFLARAACWRLPGGAAAATPFGTVDAAAGGGGGGEDAALVVLPGDATLAAADSTPPASLTATGTVLHGEPHPGGWTLAVAVADQTVRVPSPQPIAPTTQVTLQLASPRILPWGRAEEAR